MEECKEIVFPYEQCGEAMIKSFGRHYNECNVSDFVSVLISNGYKVFIDRPSPEYYRIKYGR